MKRHHIIFVFLAINGALLFFALNPWLADWQGQALVVLLIEAGLLLLIGIPVLLYQMLVRKKSFKRSLSDSLDTVLDFLSGVA